MFVNRSLEKQIEKQIKLNKIIAIVGPRQVGKTTLLKNIYDKLKGKKKFITFDNQKDLLLFEEDIDTFIEKYVKEVDFLFIDEIQYSKDSGKKLKYVYDNFKTQLFITGSSAPELSFQSLKYLVGRIIINELHGFSFEEHILASKPEYLDIYSKAKYKKQTIQEFNKLLIEHLTYGSYPEIVLEKDVENKKLLLKNIQNTYLLKEIKDLLGIKNQLLIQKFMKFLAVQSSNLLVKENVRSEIGISERETNEFLSILEKTFLCKQVQPFYKNKKKELVKTPKLYFYDMGLRNSVIDNFSSTEQGVIYENFVFQELIKENINPKFWRAKSKAEVDFIIEKEGKLLAIEVKSKKEPGIGKSGYSFIEKYSPDYFFILSPEKEEYLSVSQTKVCFLPFVKFIPYLKDIIN